MLVEYWVEVRSLICRRKSPGMLELASMLHSYGFGIQIGEDG
jgi:hypothetical protein